MQVLDIKFDDGKGDANVNLESGILEIQATDSNPSFPTNLQINVPLDPLFEKLQAQAPNLLVKWGEKAAQSLIDAVE